VILYLDTSALVKWYIREEGSPEVTGACKNAESVAVSVLAYAEALSAFARKARESEADSAVLKKAARQFKLDWDSLVLVQLTETLSPYIERLIYTYPLRGSDAVHLASALFIKAQLKEEVCFACFDRPLLAAAREEGFTTLPAAPRES
jgi:predicted nucleic acid-binding protein